MKIYYYIIEREVLAVIYYLAKVYYNIIDYRFLVIIYSNYKILKIILKVSTDAYGRIAR